MSLSGCAAITAPFREHMAVIYETGKRSVDMVHEDLTPSIAMTRDAFVNAIRVVAAPGGSTNAAPHIQAIAGHVGGGDLTIQDWLGFGFDMPILLNMQPAGKYLGERYYPVGGLPAARGGAELWPRSRRERSLSKAGRRGHSGAL